MRTSRWVIFGALALVALIVLLIARNIADARRDQRQAWEDGEHARAIGAVTLAADGCAQAQPVVRQVALDTLERLHANGQSWFDSASNVSHSICDTALAQARRGQ